MTNGEKYLKDGTDIKEFSRNMFNYLVNRDEPLKIKIENYLQEDIKPTLTEDERVILKNIDKKYTHIGRKDGTPSIELYIKSKDDFKHCWCFYNHLFQFIKERRRILY